MAFQPIVDFETSDIFAHEALVRGPGGEPAAEILDQVTPEQAARFNRECRSKAITLAAELALDTRLCINFKPARENQLETEIGETLATAKQSGFAAERLILEVVRGDDAPDIAHLQKVLTGYRAHGFSIAIDNFGTGRNSLVNLKTLAPDLVKLDISLVQNLHENDARQLQVRGIVDLAGQLGCQVIAQGVEQPEELDCLLENGVVLMQGFHFARPAFETLAEIDPAIFSGEG